MKFFNFFAAFNKVTALLKQSECTVMAKVCFKVVLVSMKIGEVVFLADPYY